MAYVDSQLAAIPNLPSRQLFFKDKVTQFWWHMVPSHFHFFSLPALRERSKNIVAQAYKEGFSKDRYRVAQLGKDYSRSQVIAVIALWKLCSHYPESERETLCRYFLEGLLDEALEDQFEEEIGPMLKGYLHTELAA